MKRLVLVPNNMGSRSARDLANNLSQKVGHKVFRVKPSRVGKRIGFALTSGTDKLTQMNRFTDAQISCPPFTTNRTTALDWIHGGNVVFCRTLLRASEGRGIVVAETAEQVVAAPLYTQYVKKKKEFRVHVFNGNIIDVQEKRKKAGFEQERNTRIRNVNNGYVFCRGGIEEPQGLRELAVRATTALNYTIGAVDIAFNERNNQLVVLEVNANPGLQGTTLENYANAIVAWYRSKL